MLTDQGLETMVSPTTLRVVHDMVTTQWPDNVTCAFQDTLRSLLLIPFALITIIAIPGNLLVMLAVYRYKKLKNPTNVLVVGLAIADIAKGVLSVPSAYFWFVNYCDENIILIFRATVRACCAISVTHLVLISIDRYVAVAKPLKYQSLITRRRTRLASIISYLIIVPYMVLVAILYYEDINNKDVELNKIVFGIFWDYFPSSCIVIAMVITSVIYSYVFHQARLLRSRMTSMMMRGSTASATGRTSRRNKQIRATKTLAIVVLAFALCWLPISIAIFLGGNPPNYEPMVSLGPTMLYYANSIMNPLIYAHRSKDFRDGFKAVIRDASRCFMASEPSLQRKSTTSHGSSSERHSNTGCERPSIISNGNGKRYRSEEPCGILEHPPGTYTVTNEVV